MEKHSERRMSEIQKYWENTLARQKEVWWARKAAKSRGGGDSRSLSTYKRAYNDSHLVVYEVCKHRRKCLAKTVFLSKSSHTSMLPVFSQN
ncbi:hypothetical protein Taro_045766 [Colocasia esculenta]|uniref:Uncharacterized protein n=1 Tax=Colocasia esculenta TaxID=4460 RepID=A0A843X5A3_COLES|nr:hypothetical protein [Colocasia esculenta]